MSERKILEIRSIPLDELPMESITEGVARNYCLEDVRWYRSEDGKYHPTYLFVPHPEKPQYGAVTSVSAIELAVINLIVQNARHKKKDVIMGKETWLELITHMDEETGELLEAVEGNDKVHQLEELGDIYGLLVHAVIKAGFSMDQVEQRELAKLKERFEYENDMEGVTLHDVQRVCDEYAATRGNTKEKLDGLPAPGSPWLEPYIPASNASRAKKGEDSKG